MNMIEGWVRQIEHHNKGVQSARVENRNRINLYPGNWGRHWRIYLQLKGEFVKTGKKYKTKLGLIEGMRFIANPDVFDVCCYGDRSIAWRVDAKEQIVRGTYSTAFWLWCASNGSNRDTWPWTRLLPDKVYARYEYATRHSEGYTYLRGLDGPDCMLDHENPIALHVTDVGVRVVEGFKPCPPDPLVTPERIKIVKHVYKRLREDIMAYDPLRARENYDALPADHPFSIETLQALRNRGDTFDHIIAWALGNDGYNHTIHAMVIANMWVLSTWRLQAVHKFDQQFELKKRLRAYVYAGNVK